MMPTREEIFEEINQLIEKYPPLLENDLTTKDIIQERGLSRNSAVELMHRLSREYPDKYKMVKVRNDNGGWQWALRKIA